MQFLILGMQRLYLCVGSTAPSLVILLFAINPIVLISGHIHQAANFTQDLLENKVCNIIIIYMIYNINNQRKLIISNLFILVKL